MDSTSLRLSWCWGALVFGLCACPATPGGAGTGRDAAAPADTALPQHPDAGPDQVDASDPADAAVEPLVVVSSRQIEGVLGVPLNVPLAANGGTPPYRWSLAESSMLPVGLMLSSDGKFAGTPTRTGRFQFSLKVIDHGGRSTAADFELHVPEAPLPNEDCAQAAPLELVAGSARVVGSLAGAHPDGASDACGHSSAQPDAFYSLDVTELSRVSIEVSSGFSIGLYNAGCESLAYACSGSIVEVLAPGHVLLAVVALDSSTLAYDLSISVEPLTGDSCADALPVDLSSGAATITGTFYGAHHGLPSCSDSVDRVFALDLTTTADLLIRPTPGHPDIWFGLLAQDCATTLSCTTVMDQWSERELSFKDLGPGTYYLVVNKDQYTYLVNSFSVDVLMTVFTDPAPANDSCATATVLNLVNDTAQVDGTLVGSTLDTQAEPPCSATNHDVFYRVSLSEASLLQFENSPPGIGLQILSGSCPQLASEQCGWASCMSTLAAGDYYLRVTGPQQPFSFTVTRRAPEPAPNASCSAAETVVLDASGQAAITGLLGSGGTEVQVPCSDYWNPKSLVYRLDVTTRSDLRIALADAVWGGWPAVGVISGSCSTGSFLGCRESVMAVDLDLFALPAGTYYVVTESFRPENVNLCAGRFTLDIAVTPSPPSPANDGCSGAIEYLFQGPGGAAAISGTTIGAGDDIERPPSLAQANYRGPDVVYALTLQSDARVRVVSPGQGESLLVYLTEECGATFNPIATAVGWGAFVGWGFVTDVLPAGTYHLVVASVSKVGQTIPSDFDLFVDTL